MFRHIAGTWRALTRRVQIGVVVVMVVATGLAVFWETQRVTYHGDEMYTIISSLSSYGDGYHKTSDENGVPIVKTREEYQSYLTFTKFDLLMVYANQAQDVHPPLYYLVFHVFAALMPGMVFKVGFIINLLCFYVTCWVMVEICVLLEKKKVILPALIFYGCSILAVDMIMFQRMYMMVAMFVMLTLYFNLRIVRNDYRMEKPEIVGLCVSVLFGYLTQYFYLIFLLIMFGIMVTKMVRRKKWNYLKRYCLLHLAMGGLGFALYPISIVHIFMGYRGVGAMAEVVGVDLSERVWGFLGEIRRSILIPFSLIVVLLGWWRWCAAKKKWLNQKKTEIELIVFPAVIYAVIVILIAPYITARYLMPVLPVLMLGVVMALAEVVKEKWLIAGMIGISVVEIAVHYPVYTMLEFGDLNNIAKRYGDMTEICYYEDSWTPLFDTFLYDRIIRIKPEDDEEVYWNILEDGEKFILKIQNTDNLEKNLEKVRKNGVEIKEKLWEDIIVIYLAEKI